MKNESKKKLIKAKIITVSTWIRHRLKRCGAESNVYISLTQLPNEHETGEHCDHSNDDKENILQLIISVMDRDD